MREGSDRSACLPDTEEVSLRGHSHQGCASARSAFMRFLASRVRSLEMKSLAFSETQPQYLSSNSRSAWHEKRKKENNNHRRDAPHSRHCHGEPNTTPQSSSCPSSSSSSLFVHLPPFFLTGGASRAYRVCLSLSLSLSLVLSLSLSACPSCVSAETDEEEEERCTVEKAKSGTG